MAKLAVLGLVVFLPRVLRSQNPSFEVASVKRNTDSVLTISGVEPEAGGRLSARAVTLRQLIAEAYQIRESLILGGASWSDSERYDIEAKAADPVGWNSGIRQMLQALLSDRFQLRVHWEPKEMPVYLLSVAKGGAKLEKMRNECTPGPNGFCGGYTNRIGLITGEKASMTQLADTLSAILDHPVLDQTGLSGLFDDIKLEWVPDETQYESWGPQAYKRAVSDPSGASLFTAIQEQLGLKLESGKRSVKVLVIDSAEKPTEN
ncbi:MAG: TIGR03435 family protein [Candidatus Acidiferrales bacterium]